MAILYVWNDRPTDEISLESIRLATQLPDTELRRTLWVCIKLYALYCCVLYDCVLCGAVCDQWVCINIYALYCCVLYDCVLCGVVCALWGCIDLYALYCCVLYDCVLYGCMFYGYECMM